MADCVGSGHLGNSYSNYTPCTFEQQKPIPVAVLASFPVCKNFNVKSSFLIDSDTNMIMLRSKKQRSIITYTVGCCFMVEDVFLGLGENDCVGAPVFKPAEKRMMHYC